jgi:hypothetical protein
LCETFEEASSLGPWGPQGSAIVEHGPAPSNWALHTRVDVGPQFQSTIRSARGAVPDAWAFCASYSFYVVTLPIGSTILGVLDLNGRDAGIDEYSIGIAATPEGYALSQYHPSSSVNAVTPIPARAPLTGQWMRMVLVGKVPGDTAQNGDFLVDLATEQPFHVDAIMPLGGWAQLSLLIGVTFGTGIDVWFDDLVFAMKP